MVSIISVLSMLSILSLPSMLSSISILSTLRELTNLNQKGLQLLILQIDQSIRARLIFSNQAQGKFRFL
jgi:hypothetical protein